MNTDLLGDPIPEPLPTNSRLTSEEQLVGHEIRAMFVQVRGTLGYPTTVIVTATGCWLVLDIGGGDLDDAYIKVDEGNVFRAPVELIGYVSVSELEAANCITDSEYRRLLALEEKHNAEAKEREANSLRKRLAELEGQK